MEEKLTMKQLLAILAAGLFSFCGVLIETATNITFPTLMNEFHISTSLSLFHLWLNREKDLPPEQLFSLIHTLYTTGIGGVSE